MAKQKPAKPLDAWVHSEGPRGSTVTVYEEWNKKGSVYLRYTLNRKPVRKSLAEYLGHSQAFSVRNARGQLLAKRQKEATAAAQACVQDLQLGRDPFRSTKAPVAGSNNSGDPTVENAITSALHPIRGMYVSDSKHKSEVIRAGDRILAALPKGMLCEEVIPSTVEVIWRHFLEQATSVKHYRRVAERTAGMLYTILKWCHDREPHRYPAGKIPMTNWKALLVRDWESKFKGERAVDPERDKPRFTAEETQKIFANLKDADQRMALMIEVAGEQRSGQVIRAKRSMLSLEPVGGFGLGILDLTACGRGKKHTTVIDLHPEARALIDRILDNGYLSNLEKAYKAGELDDYYLWPSGQLDCERLMPLDRYLKGPQRRNKRAETILGPRHMDSSSLIEVFRRYQEAIGVEIKKGRQFYGLRRVLADQAEYVQTDERVLNELTGWKDTQTRRGYQMDKDPRILKAAAETRNDVRKGFRLEDATEAEKIRIAEAEAYQAKKAVTDLSNFNLEQLQAIIEAATKQIESADGDPNTTRSNG